MKTTIKILALTIALAACGDNKSPATHPDGPPAPSPDAQCSDCPAAPALGATQLDRMGRPAINTALNHGFSDTGADAAKDAYNADKDPSGWVTNWAPEFMKNLAIIDVLDAGVCGNGICETGETCAADCPSGTTPRRPGCGNQVLYSGDPTTGGTATSYQTLAGILADDELYLDTSKTLCEFYLAVEFGVVTGMGNSTCGGRAPQYDVIDFSYSALAMGIKGFDTSFTPLFGDTVGPHTDYLTDFPYLGAPH